MMGVVIRTGISRQFTLGMREKAVVNSTNHNIMDQTVLFELSVPYHNDCLGLANDDGVITSDDVCLMASFTFP